ncbi:MAG: RNA polymerase sigma factor [Candidatus Magasanikbacteria bacterium]
MKNNADEQLVEAYLAGNDGALVELIGRYTKAIYSFCVRFVGQGSEAEDITQEVFIKVWKNLRKFDKTKKFKTWMYQIARYTAIDHLRSVKKTVDIDKFTEDESESEWERLVDSSPSPFDQLDIKEQADKIKQAINLLPEIYRTVLDLHLREEMTLAEISEVMKEKNDTVKSRYRRGLAMLRRLLANSVDSSGWRFK